MSATPVLNASWTPWSDQALPHNLARPLAANSQVGKGQLVTVAPATGYASLNDGTVPGQVAAGNGDYSELSESSAVAGAAFVRLSERWFYGLGMGTSTDAFTDADFGVPFYIKDENTLGKLSNLSGSNRSIGGLVFGLAIDGTPNAWTGVLAGLLARATLVSNAVVGGSYPHPVDASAATATAEKSLIRTPVHGQVTEISIVSALGTIVADPTDYVQVNVYKNDGAAGVHVLLGTYDSRAANQGALAAGTTKQFSLSVVAGALNLLETDQLSYEVIKQGAGKIIPVSTIRVVQKAI